MPVTSCAERNAQESRQNAVVAIVNQLVFIEEGNFDLKAIHHRVVWLWQERMGIDVVLYSKLPRFSSFCKQQREETIFNYLVPSCRIFNRLTRQFSILPTVKTNSWDTFVPLA